MTTAPEDRIRILPTTSDASVRLTVNAMGTRADVRVVAPADQSTLSIELPQRVNLVVSLDGGVLYVNGVEGDTDISAKAGDIEVSQMGRQSYRQVSVALQDGVLSALAFGPKEGGTRSLEWTGPGRHQLKIRVGNGRVSLTNWKIQ